MAVETLLQYIRLELAKRFPEVSEVNLVIAFDLESW